MKKVALIMRHSLREELNLDGTGGMLTQEGIDAARKIGENIKIDKSIPVSYFGTGVQRTIDTCRNIEYGRTGNYNIEVKCGVFWINSQKHNLCDGGWFQKTGSTLGMIELTEYALGLRTSELMYDFRTSCDVWLENMVKNMPNGLSIWVSHDYQMVPLLYGLTGMTQSEANEICERDRLHGNPWTTPLTGIAVINDNGKITTKRIKGLQNAFTDSW